MATQQFVDIFVEMFFDSVCTNGFSVLLEHVFHRLKPVERKAEPFRSFSGEGRQKTLGGLRITFGARIAYRCCSKEHNSLKKPPDLSQNTELAASRSLQV